MKIDTETTVPYSIFDVGRWRIYNLIPLGDGYIQQTAPCPDCGTPGGVWHDRQYKAYFVDCNRCGMTRMEARDEGLSDAS